MGSPQPALSLREKRVRGSTPKTLARRRVAVALAPPSFSEGARGLPGQAPKVRKSRSHRRPLGAAVSGTGTVLSIRQMGRSSLACLASVWERGLLRSAGCAAWPHRGPSMRWARRPCSCLPGRCQGELAPAGGGRTPPGVAATPGFVPGRGDERRASLGAAGLQKESGRFASQRRRAVARSRRRAPCNQWEL